MLGLACGVEIKLGDDIAKTPIEVSEFGIFLLSTTSTVESLLLIFRMSSKNGRYFTSLMFLTEINILKFNTRAFKGGE